MDHKSENTKSALEIGSLVGQLNIKNQCYVLNTINALLYSQQASDDMPKKPKLREKANVKEIE